MKIEQIKKLNLKAEDFVVLNVSEILSDEAHNRIKHRLAEQLQIDARRVIVLGHECTLSVLSKGKGKANAPRRRP